MSCLPFVGMTKEPPQDLKYYEGYVKRWFNQKRLSKQFIKDMAIDIRNDCYKIYGLEVEDG